MTFEPVICDASFRESKAITVAGVRFINGRCRVCGQPVGAVVVRPGIARINFHYREGQAALEALGCDIPGPESKPGGEVGGE